MRSVFEQVIDERPLENGKTAFFELLGIALQLARKRFRSGDGKDGNIVCAGFLRDARPNEIKNLLPLLQRCKDPVY